MTVLIKEPPARISTCSTDPRESIPEIDEKYDPFDAFAGSSAKYRVHKERKRTKKAEESRRRKISNVKPGNMGSWTHSVRLLALENE